MQVFQFEAVDSNGRSQRGVIEAESARAARAQLRGRGLLPLQVELDQRTTRPRLGFSRKLSGREQAVVTRQLASLLTAGLPLAEGLLVLSEQAEHRYVRELLAAVRTEILGGQTLAGALSQHPRDFPEIYRAIVAAGEHTGKLGMVLSRLAD